MTDIAIVTHAGMPDGAPDDLTLASALKQRGASVRFAVWNDPAIDWSAAAHTVIRSTWDYHLHPAEWYAWLDRVDSQTRLTNPAVLMRWNSDKRYLFDLASAGVSIVPTVVVERADDVLGVARHYGWNDIVIKPAIGASARGARRYYGAGLGRDASSHAVGLLAQGAVLMQPYQSEIETARERSLVYIDGRYAHAFTKPGFHTALHSDGYEAHDAMSEEIALADRVIHALHAHPIVARMDMIPSESGPLLMEAELIEPQLGLNVRLQTTHELAEALVKRLRCSAYRT